ncbi:rod shape-determining protein MreD [Nocardioides marmorisolisilvae]|uniref:Rod shape-determining protein MreD n=1 Tax=Nocardioides marmorisolisilvae TaxID=1542737 RepID=A0A3N0DTT3_9ACTN|nr:rod shape-determining protein MreD [Nocardioides marmorisolisilvae]RNL78803.1 rod shape-determining protein MreD [Nocardioides marmorisolisilvae]
MTAMRSAALTVLVCFAIVAQTVIFRFISVDGVVPNLALILVVVAAIARGSQFAAVLGFGAGLLLDLAPPADHIAGRWALALVIVGYLAGRVRQDARTSPMMAVVLVGAASFIGTSLFALSGAVLGDGTWAIDETIRVIVISVLWDLMLAPFLVPLLLWLLDRVRPARLALG